MNYLTKVLLGPTALRKENIRDDYSIHRFVYSLFPLEKELPPCRFLYADKGAVQGGRVLLILSSKEPECPVYVSSSTVIIADHFWEFSDYRFEVELNPVRKNKFDGKRRAVTGQLELLQWFVEHSAKWGFSVDTRFLEVESKQTRQIPKGNGTAVFNRAKFRGRLHVEDKELFRTACTAGIGHGKAFGFGLLQLDPVYSKTTDNKQ